jgi:glycogen phosphorylase
MTLRATLTTLSRNLLWTWKPWFRAFWEELSGEDFHENPVRFIRELSDEKCASLESDAAFMKSLKALQKRLKLESEECRVCCPDDLDKRTIAYFSAEYGLHDTLPIYSGGLGVLSGDHLKSAHDLGLPLVAMGLFYRQGYFRQRIDGQGQQHADMVHVNTEDLPAVQVLKKSGEALTVSVELPGRNIELAIWEVRVGDIRLFLLDADREANSDEDRRSTWQLYGGDRDMRMVQEIILGIGGVRALRSMNLKPDLWHMNEGHSAFLAVERVRERMAQGLSFKEAVEVVSASTVFTTHTPVPAGNEAFVLPRLHSYFQAWCERYDMDFNSLLELGTLTDKEGYKDFSLTALALRLSRFAGGVSRLHGEVSRKMWYHLWHQVPIAETPIGHVTNGVHMATWVAPEYRELFEEQLGEAWESALIEDDPFACLRSVPLEEIWNRHQPARARLFKMVRENQEGRFGAESKECKAVLDGLRENALMIGFARRFATYKRALLLFSDPDRLDKLVNNSERPLTFLFAGKAHPADMPGQALIRQLHELTQDPRFVGRIILLEGYSLDLARTLVQGVDVWLNTPRRPLEASGTSGMKLCPNGGINLSISDGWWEEAENGDNGWTIGTRKEFGDNAIQDYYDARSLFELLEKTILPMYHDRNELAFSETWAKVMRESLITCTAEFSTARMLKDYTRGYYLPALQKGLRAKADGHKAVLEFISYSEQLLERWYHMTDISLNTRRDGERVSLSAELYLGLLNPDDVKVELFARDGECIVTFECQFNGKSADEGVWRYSLDVSDPCLLEADLKVRVLPKHDWLDHDMEMGMCYWFHRKAE